MSYGKLLNSGLESWGSLDSIGIVKWLLGLIVIFIIVQNYWELHTGKIYVFSYHRFKSKKVWLLKQTAKVFLICLLYSGILFGINVLISDVEILELAKLWILYALFIFNMNYFFCIINMQSKMKFGLWVLIFGVSAVLCSTATARQYWNFSSYGMLLQQTAPNDYMISIVVNIAMTLLMIVIKMLTFKRRVSK